MSTVYDIFHRQSPTPQQAQNQPQFSMNDLMQFARTLRGNPEMMVRNMIQNGIMTPEQFDQLSKQANQISGMFNLR